MEEGPVDELMHLWVKRNCPISKRILIQDTVQKTEIGHQLVTSIHVLLILLLLMVQLYY